MYLTLQSKFVLLFQYTCPISHLVSGVVTFLVKQYLTLGI